MRRLSLAVVLGLIVTGCTVQGANPGSCVSSPLPVLVRGRVVAVADGDTITVQDGGQRQRVRLLGIDAPEVAHDRPAECGADAARHALADLVAGKIVTVLADPRADQRDRYGRLLGYVEVAGVDVGERQVSGGYAEAWRPSNAVAPVRLGCYAQAQRSAQIGRAGSWSVCSRLGR